MPIIAALEVAGWSLQTVLDRPTRTLATRAARQASQLARPGHRRWIAWLVSGGLSLKILGFVAPRVVPFDLETYLRVHFSKVGSQTRGMLGHYCERAQASSQPYDALQTLLERLD